MADRFNAALEDPGEGGCGLFLTRNLMDEVRFREDGSGTEVARVKRPSAARAAARAWGGS